MTAKSSGSKPGKKAAQDQGAKKFKAALEELDKIVQERMLLAGDQFSVGIKMAKELRKLAERIENEVESINMAETAYGHDVGIGIGVL